MFSVNKVLRQIVSIIPPPEFILMPAAAVDISDSSIKYIDTKYTSAGFVPNNFKTFELAKGIVSSGIINDTVALADVLKQIVEDKSTRKFVFVSLPEELSYVFTTSIRMEKQFDIYKAIEFELEEHVPVSVKDAIFDYDVISEQYGILDLSVTVYEKNVINGYLEAFNMAGLTVKAFELEANSLIRSVVPKYSTETSMVVDFGRARTGITIARGGNSIFTTTVHFGGGMIDEIIMKKMEYNQQQSNIYKSEKGLLDKTNKQFQKELISSVKILSNEIKRHYDFWSSRRDENGFPKEQIKKIYICGGASALLGLKEFLTDELNVPVDYANVWQNLFDINDYIPDIEPDKSRQYATAIGLLLLDSI